MSRENVEVSLRGFRLFETGDIEALGELYDERAEIWHPEGWPEPGPSVGRDAVIAQFRTLREGWAEHQVIVEEIEDLGDWVLARVRWKGRTEKTEANFEMPYSAATRFEDARIVEVHYCWEHADALSATRRSDAQRGAAAGAEAQPAKPRPA